jgi:hypothetical protein
VCGSMWSRLAELPLVVDDHAHERLERPPAFGRQRGTDLIRLAGGGEEGLGEDITVYLPEGTAAPPLELAGQWTLGSFCDHLASIDQWTEPPQWDLARAWRNWGYESAALDLALRQAGRSLHDALGVTPAPVRFVNSFGLGDPPQFATLQRRLDRYPDLRFKLDAEPTWDRALLEEIAATGAVETVDFKGRYGLEVKDPEALVPLYERVVDVFATAILEDPHDEPGVAEVLAPHRDRVSFDAPIRSAGDIADTRVINVKPSRIGSVRALLEVYATCRERGVRMYGGGMGELGPARGQIELLASLFHPDGPNDVAPTPYNDEDLPDGLPASPLEPRPAPTGFRWAG